MRALDKNFFSIFWVLPRTSRALPSKPVPWGLFSHHPTSPLPWPSNISSVRKQLCARVSSGQGFLHHPAEEIHWQKISDLCSSSLSFSVCLLYVQPSGEKNVIVTPASVMSNSNSFYLRFLCFSKHFSKVCKLPSHFSLAEVSEVEWQNKSASLQILDRIGLE